MTKNKLRLLSLLSCFGALSAAKAQNYTPNYLLQPSSFITQNFDLIDSSGWLQTLPESYVSFTNFIAQNKSSFGMGNDDNFVLVKTTNDDYPFMEANRKLTHHRYNQTYKGMKVEYAELFLHHKNDSIKIINCKLAEGLNMSIIPTLTETQATAAAIAYLGDTNLYSWQDTAWEAAYKEEMGDSNATTYPSPELIIAKKIADQNYAASEFVLAYKMSIHALNPDLDVTIYINAHTGEFVKQTSNRHEGHADLSYGYGTNKWIDTRYRGGVYNHHILYTNDVAGRVIYTKKVRYGGIVGGTWVSRFGGIDKNNSYDHDDVWYSERAGETTPHWVATQTWDYFKSTFNRTGMDNAGGQIKVYANGDQLNAFYSSGEDLIFFGRNGSNHVGTKDIVGHEYTHGVTKYAAGLVYEKESGALNESFSDIFGYEIERYLNGGMHTNWELGEDAWLVRKMNNPSNSPSIPQPSVYLGPRWYSTVGCIPNDGNDKCGVHINSGVQNYWFYLLTTGSAAAPDGTFGGATVSGIGADKARNITYYNLDVFMGNNSGYIDARAAGYLAAGIIYGHCSNEQKQTKNAWAAVGIGKPIGALTITGPSIIYRNSAGAIIGAMPKNYTASGGEGRNSWSYSGPWSYTTLGGFRNNLFTITNFNGSFSSSNLTVSSGCESFTKTISFFCVDCPITNPDNTYQQNPTLSVSPNPSTGLISISASYINPNANEPIYVTIIDANGIYQVQQSYQQQLPQSMNISNLLPGNYTLIVQQGNRAQQITFTKQ